jgi:hypothetical protein
MYSTKSHSSKYLIAVALTLLLAGRLAFADNLTINWNNDANSLLRNSSNAALFQGAAGTNNDGALIQLGYFSSGTSANNFLGTWIPLTGATAVGRTTIGDSADLTGAGAGIFQFNTFFATGTSNVDVYANGLDSGYYQTHSSISIAGTPTPNPANLQVLAIRFYDTNAGTTGFFNTVSSDATTWQWHTPDNVTVINIDLTGSLATLEWQDAANPFKTTLPTAIPEPSTLACLLLGGAGTLALGARRRFKS